MLEHFILFLQTNVAVRFYWRAAFLVTLTCFMFMKRERTLGDLIGDIVGSLVFGWFLWPLVLYVLFINRGWAHPLPRPHWMR